MLRILVTNNFKKDIKKLQKAGGYNFAEFDIVISSLLDQQTLPPKYKNHRLLGRHSGYFDCHIKDNWVLIYKIEGEALILARTGTHAEVLGL